MSQEDYMSHIYEEFLSGKYQKDYADYWGYRAKVLKLRAKRKRAEFFKLASLTLVCVVLGLSSIASSFYLLSMYI